MLMSCVLFYIGLVISYVFVFPIVFHFFILQTPSHVEIMTDIRSYLSFSITLSVIVGVIFEIPIVIVTLVSATIVERSSFKKNRKYIILVCFIGAMFISPPDVLSQTFFAIPMIFLFELGLFISKFVPKIA